MKLFLVASLASVSYARSLSFPAGSVASTQAKKWDDLNFLHKVHTSHGPGQGDCSSLGQGAAPMPDKDDWESFMEVTEYSKYANSAETPANYNLVFQDLNATVNHGSYIGHYTLYAYDPEICATYCAQIPECKAFNIYVARDPSLDPGPLCPNPPATANYKCALYSESIDEATVNNDGQRQPPADENGIEFYVKVRASNGYNSNALVTEDSSKTPLTTEESSTISPSTADSSTIPLPTADASTTSGPTADASITSGPTKTTVTQTATITKTVSGMILAQNTIHVTHTETVTVGCSTRSNYRRGGPTFGRLPPAPTGRVPRSPSESAINFPTSTLTEPSNATAQFKNAGTSSSKSTHTKGPKLMLNLYANMTIDRIQELILDLTTDLQVVEARVKDLKCKWTPAKAQYDETNESLAPANKGSKYLETKKAYHTEMVSDDKSLSGDQKKLLDSVGWKIEDIRRAIQDSKIVQANVQANVHHIEAKVALNLEKGHKLRKDIASVEKFLATLSKNIAKTADAVLGDDDE